MVRRFFVRFERVVEEFADRAAAFSASPWFLVLHIIWFAVWIILSVEQFPYGLLTMIVSLEAIILSSLILSSTNREAERDRQSFLRNLKFSKDTHEMLEHVHNDVADIKEYLMGHLEDVSGGEKK